MYCSYRFPCAVIPVLCSINVMCTLARYVEHIDDSILELYSTTEGVIDHSWSLSVTQYFYFIFGTWGRKSANIFVNVFSGSTFSFALHLDYDITRNTMLAAENNKDRYRHILLYQLLENIPKTLCKWFFPVKCYFLYKSRHTRILLYREDLVTYGCMSHKPRTGTIIYKPYKYLSIWRTNPRHEA